MLIAYKDSALLYPVTPQRPLTFFIPEAGGSKEIRLWIHTDRNGAVIQVGPMGSDPSKVTVKLRPGGQDWVAGASFNYPVAVPLSTTEMPILVSARPGPRAEDRSLVIRIAAYVGGNVVEEMDANCRIVQLDQGLSVGFRTLPANRIVQPALPGFRFGRYRWRGEAQTNSREIVPTNWNVDPVAVGTEKFIAGIGYREDLALVDLERESHSVFPRIKHGFYFTGHNEYFCPSQDGVIEIVEAAAGLEFPVRARPRQLPVFVGTFRQDDHGYYDADVSYRSIGKGFGTADGFDPADPGYQFVLDRATSTIRLNRAINPAPVFAGFAPEASETTIEVPVYPVTEIVSVYLDEPNRRCASLYDPGANTLRILFPPDHVGRKIFIDYLPALEVLYEGEGGLADPEGTRLLSNTDLNPAFSGISRGYLYLMHRRHKAKMVELAADKPRILVPPTAASIVGLVAFGPVYYENDFALLMATVSGSTTQELIPNVRLRMVPGPEFQGLINYTDPVAQIVEVVSGGDGNASFVYTPPKAYGYYLDGPTSVAGTVITLPEPAAFTQLWNPDEGWLPTTYVVRNDHPYLGKVDANLAFGEVAWQTWNEPGSRLYRTNGMRQIWRTAQGSKVLPIQARDGAGTAALLAGVLNPAFSGSAVTLEYADPLPVEANIGAYFISFIGRVQLQVSDPLTGLISNTILLQLESPPEIKDAPDVAGYLYLNSAEEIKQGRMNSNRLGGAAIPQYAFSSPRY